MHPVKLSVICALAVALNFLVAFVFFERLHIPLFLDTIFTVAVVFYCGLVPALCVSVSYNVINAAVWNYKGGVSDPFIFCTRFAAFLSWFPLGSSRGARTNSESAWRSRFSISF